MTTAHERFALVVERDGLAAAFAYADRAYRAYRMNLYGRSTHPDRRPMSNPDFRGPWIREAIVFRGLR